MKILENRHSEAFTDRFRADQDPDDYDDDEFDEDDEPDTNEEEGEEEDDEETERWQVTFVPDAAKGQLWLDFRD